MNIMNEVEDSSLDIAAEGENRVSLRDLQRYLFNLFIFKLTSVVIAACQSFDFHCYLLNFYPFQEQSHK